MNEREKIVTKTRHLGMHEMANAVQGASDSTYPTFLMHLTSALHGYEAALHSTMQEQPSLLRPESFMRKQRLVRELMNELSNAKQEEVNRVARESMLPIEVA